MDLGFVGRTTLCWWSPQTIEAFRGKGGAGEDVPERAWRSPTAMVGGHTAAVAGGKRGDAGRGGVGSRLCRGLAVS